MLRILHVHQRNALVATICTLNFANVFLPAITEGYVMLDSNGMLLSVLAL
jgi:hypothetical protein